MNPRCLVVDLGNTSATLGLRGAKGIEDTRRYPRRNGARANLAAAADAYRQSGAEAVVIGSVVPRLTRIWGEGLAERLQLPWWELQPGAPLPIAVDYPRPQRIGADRLANAVAAVHRVGAPVVVADFGTALTFDIITAERGYVGGVIAPGIDMMYDYFAERTALLPRITPEPRNRIIGTSTEEAMHAGAYFGYRGMVREIVREVRRELRRDPLPLLATGGFASQVLRDFEESVMIHPHLTLEGLALAWDHARSTS